MNAHQRRKARRAESRGPYLIFLHSDSSFAMYQGARLTNIKSRPAIIYMREDEPCSPS